MSVLTSLAVQWLGLHACTRRGTGSIPGQGTKILQPAWCPPPKKNLSVCGDPVCHLHWDWATSTALPLGAHCSHQFLRITVAQLIFGLFAPNIILISGSANFGFSLYLHFVFLSTFTWQHRWVMQQGPLWSKWPGCDFCLPHSGEVCHSPSPC